MKTRHYLLIVVAAVFASRAALAQEGFPLTGVVEDQNGGMVMNAKLTLTSKAGDELKAKPKQEGQFRFESVPPGDYTLKVKAEEFETAELTVKIRNTEPKPLRIRMELKSKDEEVTVNSKSEDPLTLDAGENAGAVKIDENMLSSLPVEGQDVLGAISNFLSPAAQGSMGPSVIVDGMEASAFDVPEWSIKRIRINKNPYSAQFRRPGSSRIEVTTRDSRSNFHGGVSIFERDSALDARNPLSAAKPDTSKRLFQGRVTGPIRGTPLWYFFNIERVNDNQSAIVNALTLNGPFQQNVAAPNYRTNFLGRIDIRPNQMHAMNVRYTLVENAQHNRGVGGFRLPEGGYASGERESNIQFADHRISNAGFNNDFRVQFERSEDHEGGPAAVPSTVVKGAFTAGPSQNFDNEDETTVRVQNLTEFYKGKHRIQFGGQIRPRFIDARQQSDFAGVFEFSSLSTFAAGRPYVFRFNQGNPSVSFTQHEGFDFIQDQVRLTPNLHILAGFRHEWHGSLEDSHHVAPRIGLAWSPGQSRKTVVRAGAGVFYESFPKSITRRRLLFNGDTLHEFVIPNPSYPDPFAAGPLALPPQSIVRLAPGTTLPFVAQASVGVERAITQQVQLAVEYRALRALHLYQTRDINAPLPATGVRPDPNFLNITEVESAGSMRSNAVEVDLRWSSKRFSGMAQYTFSRTNDNVYGLFSSPANSYDLRPEWGPADYDRRHQVNFMGSANAPGKVRFGTIVTIGSSLPYNITTGEDNNGDTVAADRPFGVTRNTARGAGLVQLNLRATKLFETRRLLKKHKKDFTNLELNVDLFNVLNHANFDRFVGVLNSPFFGTANAALPGRTVQTSLRYSW